MTNEAWTYYYKCRMCGEEFHGCTGSEQTTFFGMVEMLTSETAKTSGNPVGRLDIHHCDSNREGIGDLIGRRKGEPS